MAPLIFFQLAEYRTPYLKTANLQQHTHTYNSFIYTPFWAFILPDDICGETPSFKVQTQLIQYLLILFPSLYLKNFYEFKYYYGIE